MMTEGQKREAVSDAYKEGKLHEAPEEALAFFVKELQRKVYCRQEIREVVVQETMKRLSESKTRELYAPKRQLLITFALGISRNVRADIERQIRIRYKYEKSDLDAPVADDPDGQTRIERIPDDKSPSPEEVLIRKERYACLHKAIEQLTDMRRKVVTLYFGYPSADVLSLNESDDVEGSFERVASVLQISQENARQHKHRALEDLKRFVSKCMDKDKGVA